MSEPGQVAVGQDVPRHAQQYARGGRFPLLDPSELDDAQRAVYEAVAGPPRAGGPFLIADDDGHLAGPFNAMLYSPVIGQALQELGAALRFGGSLAARTKELVICAVAASLESDYEWYAHSRVAAEAGVSEAELGTLRRGELLEGELPETVTGAERAALQLAAALLSSNRVDAGTHAAALRHFGHAGVTELTVLVGYYQTLAGLLAVGDVPAPAAPGSAPEDPPIPEDVQTDQP